MRYEKGSEWRRWDLHLHTPSSYDYGDKSVTNEELINGLASNNISLVAITDHHVIDIERLTALQRLGKEKNITVLPGIEFLSDARGNQPVHMIGIFHEKCNIEHIWGQIENRTKINEIKGSNKKHNEVYCNLHETIDLVHELGGVITIHSGQKHGSIETITNSLPHNMAQKKDIALNVDIFELGKAEDQQGYIDHVFPAINKRLPIIICSDNHNINKYAVKENCWIKADPTFEGLKQIICEPEDRVKIQANKPEEKSGYQVIDSVNINDAICKQTIILNPNLNTIIGGRSTGKSTLLQLIAHKIDRTIGVKEYIKSTVTNVSIKWQDSEENQDRDIQYFPQSHMYDLANDEKKKNKLIDKIVKEKDTEYFLDNYERFCTENESGVQANIDNLFKLQNEQDTLSQSLKEKGDKKGIETEVEIIQEKIKEIQNDDFSADDLQNFESSKKRIIEENQSLQKIQNDRQEITTLKEQPLLDQSLLYKFNALSELSNEAIKVIYTEIAQQAKSKWENGLSIHLQELDKQKVKYEEKINNLEKSPSFIKGQEHLATNKQYTDLSERLKIEVTKLNEITALQGTIDTLKEQIKTLFDETITKHVDFFKTINKLTQDFSLQHDDIEIKITTKFQKEKCKGLLHDFVKRQSNKSKDFVTDWETDYENHVETVARQFLKSALEKNIELKLHKSMDDLAKGLLTQNWFSISYQLTYQNDTFDTMSDGKKAFVILKLLLEFSNKKCPILIDQPEDSLDNRAIYNELVTYIKQKKKDRQIILVTHNANVVVNADAEEIIVANQHGDNSENTNKIKFQYISGSLENTKPKDSSTNIILDSQGIREHVCEILEGGSEAFKKRENKYGI